MMSVLVRAAQTLGTCVQCPKHKAALPITPSSGFFIALTKVPKPINTQLVMSL